MERKKEIKHPKMVIKNVLFLSIGRSFLKISLSLDSYCSVYTLKFQFMFLMKIVFLLTKIAFSLKKIEFDLSKTRG